MHRNCWSFTNHHQEHDPNILSPPEVKSKVKDCRSPRWTFPSRELSPGQCAHNLLKPSHIFGQNLSKLNLHVQKFQSRCWNDTYSYSNHQHRSRADAWSGSGVYFAHVWTSQTWSNPKPEITTVTKSPPYLYSTKHHLISPHSKPQNNSTSPAVSSPQVHKAHGGSHTPYIKSTSSTTGEKNQLPPSRCLQLPHLVQGLPRRGHRRSESRGKWGGLGPGSHPFCAFNAGEINVSLRHGGLG